MIFNFIGFNVSWFGLILLGDSFIPFTLCWLASHLYLCRWRVVEIKLILSIVAIGATIDSLLIFAGVFEFGDRVFIPLWLITLWAAFGSTISHSLHYLAKHKLWQFVIGTIAPPLSYLAGASFLAVELGQSKVTTFFLLAPIWGVLLVVFFSIHNELHRKENEYA